MIDHLAHSWASPRSSCLPIQAYIDDRFLVSKGLRNHWGYNSLAFFAAEPRYMSQGTLNDFQDAW